MLCVIIKKRLKPSMTAIQSPPAISRYAGEFSPKRSHQPINSICLIWQKAQLTFDYFSITLRYETQ
jgi:hypothetical protein